ncbi:hypothetical protein TELCIR_10364 [Teladorsagia circumcincta]|uniref:Uncharacterized protein n=1 Tax=Teladorsagia circumcincta TaxID=45464 RepID=A0A2G9UCB1_TELCI|nr:hypothetical protein TELCIR_10364 [Teladorsagia circumcincta]
MPIGALTRPQPSIRQLRMPGGEQLYVREDMDVDVQSIAQPPQTKIPVKRHIRVHWIRVDNEEEPPQEKKAKKASHGSGMSSTDLPAALRKRVTLPAELAAPSVSFRMAAQGIPKKEQILVKPSFLEPLSVKCATMSVSRNQESGTPSSGASFAGNSSLCCIITFYLKD